MNYDYSLVEKIKDVKYRVAVLSIIDNKEDREFLEKVLSDENVKIERRNDYFNEKTGCLYVHIEWAELKMEKASVFERNDDGT